MATCECGCGEEVGIAKRTVAKYGMVKGEPVRFRPGHHRRPSKPQYIVDPETQCWNWNWSLIGGGYGQITPKNGGTSLAHVVFYERLHGPVPPGLELDHKCRNRRCVNPDHVEPVTRKVNARRGSRTKLTDEQVQRIRDERGKRTQREVAVEFGISRTHVGYIWRGDRWS